MSATRYAEFRATWGDEPAPTNVTFRACLADEPGARALLIEGRRRAPLLTGKRGTRRRVDHARERRVASWRRRRERRHGVWAASRYTRTYFPHAVLVPEAVTVT